MLYFVLLYGDIRFEIVLWYGIRRDVHLRVMNSFITQCLHLFSATHNYLTSLDCFVSDALKCTIQYIVLGSEHMSIFHAP